MKNKDKKEIAALALLFESNIYIIQFHSSDLRNMFDFDMFFSKKIFRAYFLTLNSK